MHCFCQCNQFVMSHECHTFSINEQMVVKTTLTDFTGNFTMTQTIIALLSVFFFPFRALWLLSFTASSMERYVSPSQWTFCIETLLKSQDSHAEIAHSGAVVILRKCSLSVVSLWLPRCTITHRVLKGGWSCEYESPAMVIPAVSPPLDLLAAYFLCSACRVGGL